MAVLDVAGAATEVDDILAQRRPECVVVAAREGQHYRTGAQHLLSVVPAGMDDAEAAQRGAKRRKEHAVVGEGVERAVVTEPVVQGRGKHVPVRGQNSAGMVGHQQSAAGRREGFQAPHLRPEPSPDNRRDRVDQRLGEEGIPLGDLGIAGCVVVHVFPFGAIGDTRQKST